MKMLIFIVALSVLASLPLIAEDQEVNQNQNAPNDPDVLVSQEERQPGQSTVLGQNTNLPVRITGNVTGTFTDSSGQERPYVGTVSGITVDQEPTTTS